MLAVHQLFSKVICKFLHALPSLYVDIAKKTLQNNVKRSQNLDL